LNDSFSYGINIFPSYIKFSNFRNWPFHKQNNYIHLIELIIPLVAFKQT